MLRLPGRVRRYLRPMVRAGEVLDTLRNLPQTDCGTLLRDGPVLVIAPHPDDESLGCGGLLAACREHGLPSYAAVLTNGAASHPHSREYPPARLAALREAEARSALLSLGLEEDRIVFLGWPDGHAPTRGASFDLATDRLASFARSRGIRTICTTWEHDPHHDHHAAWRVGRQVARALDARLLCYPVWGWTIPPDTWLPAMHIAGARLDITRYLAAKRRAIACHRSQLTDLIADDPTGFRLSPDMLALLERPFEVFCEIN
jgi:LmbE family N-acetylglucosaminyl deacetylase